jgi:hypothetical protein
MKHEDKDPQMETLYQAGTKRYGRRGLPALMSKRENAAAMRAITVNDGEIIEIISG